MSDPTVDQSVFNARNVRTNPADAPPRSYVVPRTNKTPTIDGTIDEAIWGHAPWTEDFVDIEGDRQPNPRFRTRAKMLWDDYAFYFAVEMEEPHVWGKITQHDAVIYQDNDFEIFIDPSGSGHHYGEIEVNALNTTWDLMLDRPYRAGGSPYNGWEMHGVRTAVSIKGTLNDPSDVDLGWSGVVAIPWSALQEIAKRDCPPKDGDQWRVNFSRVEWQTSVENGEYQKVPGTSEGNWVWSPQSAIDMHRPERWGVVQFSSRLENLPEARTLDDWQNRIILVTIWEEQQEFHRVHGRYANSVAELGVDHAGLEIEATTNQFEARLGTRQTDHQLRFSEIRSTNFVG
jgi:Carbohydrate family 9 binding domain-like